MPAAAIDLDCIEDHFGLFRTRRAAERALAEIAEKRGLCVERLGLAHRGEACTVGAPGDCRGNCVGRDGDRRQDARLLAALAPLRLRAWPYAGPIGLREYDRTSGKAEVHVVERWQYVGSATDDAGLASILQARVEPRFVQDDYRLFTRLLGRHKSGLEILVLGRSRPA